MKIPHFFLAICVLAIPAHAHHGPFEKESESRFHEMHLGMAQTLDPNGVSDTYSIQSNGLEYLKFGTESLRPNIGAGPEPLKFEVSTEKIVGYGPGTVSTQSGFSAGNAAAMTATGMFLAAPIFLPLALLTSGQSSTSYAYTVVVMSENGRLQPRQITLWSQKDVGYFNSYLKEATGLEIGEMKTESELNVCDGINDFFRIWRSLRASFLSKIQKNHGALSLFLMLMIRILRDIRRFFLEQIIFPYPWVRLH